MSNSDLIQGLVATASPVKTRRVAHDLLILAIVALVHGVGAYLLLVGDGFQKAMMWDPARAIFKMSFLGIGALGFSVLAILSFDPSARRVAPVSSIMMAVMLFAAVVGFDWALAGSFDAVFHPTHGSGCMVGIVSLSIPVALVLSLLMMRGASVQPKRSALLIGLAGGTWGAFVYSLQCPFVSIWYLAAWYGGGIAIVTLVARLVLPRMARW